MKLIKFGCFLIVLIVLAAILYPSLRKATLLSTLSKNNIDVSMHDPSTLQTMPWYSSQIGASLRLPANFPSPTLTTLPDAKYAFSAMRLPEIYHIAILDRGSKSFEQEVAESRLAVSDTSKYEITTEGVAQIAGMHTYVFEIHIKSATPMHSRFYIIQGEGTAVYVLAGTSPESMWPTFSDISDSAASTFALGEPPPYTPPANQAAAAQPPRFSTNPSSPFDRPNAPSDSQENARSSPIPAQPPSNTPPSDSSRTPSSSHSVQVLVDGTWIHGWILKKEGDKTFVRYFPRGKSAQTVWATDDQLRPFDAQRMREEADASFHPQHPDPSAAPPSSGAQPQPTHIQPATPSHTPAPTPVPSEDMTLDTATKLLTSSTATDQTTAIQFLTSATPDSAHRSKIISALRPLLDADKSVALPAARALALWSDGSAERDIIAQFQLAPREKRRPYFEYLTARKTAAAARAVAARLHVSEDVIAAEEALESMDSIAEPAVRDLVADKDPAVAKFAIDVLAVIGTKDSLPALDKATENPDSKFSSAALSAMQRIQSRIH